jgi:hypothetical protein
MPKLLTRLLLLTLSAFSISVSADFNENPNPEYLPPKVDGVTTYACTNSSNNTQQRLTLDACTAYHNSLVPPDSESKRYTDCNYSGSGTSFTFTCQMTGRTSSGWIPIGRATMGRRDSPQNSDSLSCPPESNPKYTDGPRPIDPSNPNSPEMCFPKFKPCPLGFMAHAVTPLGGVEQCVPISCPSKGTVRSNIKNFDNVLPVNGEGTYCDGSCSYSVTQGAISYQGQKFATGTSNGAICGQGPGDKNKFTPLDDEDSCVEHTLSSGAIFQNCSEGIDDPVDEQPDPTPPIEDSLVDEDVVVDPFTGIDCTTVDDKMTCVGKNITDAITEQTKKQAKLDAEKHNKLAKQQKEITDYVESQAVKREQRRASDAAATIESIDNVARTVSSVLGDGSGGNGQGNQAIIDALAGIGEGLGETDTETDSTPTEGIESFYEPEYPNGFADVWNNNQALFNTTSMSQYLDSWKTGVGAGVAPDINFCFNMGGLGDFGCVSPTIDPRVFPFLRIIILVSTAFLCRALVFGG